MTVTREKIRSFFTLHHGRGRSNDSSTSNSEIDVHVRG